MIALLIYADLQDGFVAVGPFENVEESVEWIDRYGEDKFRHYETEVLVIKEPATFSLEKDGP